MEAHELRIGNYFKVYQTEEKVYDIFYDTDEGVRFINDYNISIIEPIPLTEEWLLKSGADKVDNTEFTINRFRLKYQDVYKFWYVTDLIDHTAYITKIEYVHEYQNMFFALNGDDLKL